MRKFKPTYIQTKKQLRELFSEERDLLLFMHSFLVSKLCNNNIEQILAMSNISFDNQIITQANAICEESFKEISYDINTLSRTFELNLDQKKNGIFYTDKLVVDYVGNFSIYNTFINNAPNTLSEKIKNYGLVVEENIASNLALKEKFFGFLKTLNKSEIDLLKKKIQNLKFFDPTCGDGAFLIHAFYQIYECLQYIDVLQNKKEVDPIKILENNIYGNDFNMVTVDFLKLKFIYILLSENISISKNINFNISNLDFIEYSTTNMFDCIIGNPPYFENKNLNILGYKTEKINNIYAPILEKCTRFLTKNGIMGMVVPISLISTPRMFPLRELLKGNFELSFISSFADRPGSLFTQVHQKINIFIGVKNKNFNKKLYTSSYFYFNKDEYESLFSKIHYIENNWDKVISKYGNETEKEIISKIYKSEKNIFDYIIKEGEHILYLNMRVGFWIKAFAQDIGSKEFKKFSFKNENEKYLFMAILNSNLFYLFWVLESDGWHITLKNLENFKFDLSVLTNKQINELIKLAKELEIDLEKNKEAIHSKQSDYEYKHKKSKKIIDKIDFILKDIYFFDKSVLKYIQFFNLKYRMSNDYKNYLESINE